MRLFHRVLRLAIPVFLVISLVGCGGDDNEDFPIPPPDGDQDVGANRPPVADAGEDRRVLLDQPATLDAGGSSDPDGDPLSFAWEIVSRPANSLAELTGDDTEQATFTPDREGVYTARLTVGDGQVFAQDTLALSAVPPGTNLPPMADPGPDRSAPVNSVVSLNGLNSTDPNEDPLSYTWELVSRPTESSAVLSDPTAAESSFTADVTGDYELRLVVDDGLETDSATVVVTAISDGNAPPVADAGRDRNVPVGTLVILDGSGSFDPEGTPLTYSWTILQRPAASDVILTMPNSPSPTFTADENGIYTLELTVLDSDGARSSDQVTISAGELTGESPMADAGPDRQVPVGALVILDGSGSTDPNGNLLNFSWTMLERPLGSNVTLQAPTNVSTSFSPDREGTYEVQLTVTDPDGNLDTDVVVVLAGVTLSGQQIYDERCAVCHSLGNYDPFSSGGASDLLRLGDRVPLVFDPTHVQITLTSEEIIAVQQFLNSF